MRTQAFKSFLLAAVVVLAGCVTPPRPQNFAETVTAAKTVLTITNDTTAILVNGGYVSKPKGAEVLERTVAARIAVQTAAGIGELRTAIDMIRAAQQLLCKDLKDNPNCALLLQQGAKL